jgi:hypothetical protein
VSLNPERKQMGEPSCSNERGRHRSAVLVRRGGPPGVREQGRAVMGSSGKLGEPTFSSTIAGSDHTGESRSKGVGALFACGRQERESNRGNRSRAKCEGRETGRGSLSIFIVAIESRVTHPKEPVISKGGCRDYGPVTGNAPGAQNPDQCVT